MLVPRLVIPVPILEMVLALVVMNLRTHPPAKMMILMMMEPAEAL